MPVSADQVESRAIVRATDGPAGLVERAVVSPRSGLLSHLVIERPGVPDTFWVVPVDAVASTAPDLVCLRLSRADLAQLPAQRRHQGEWLRPDPALPPADFPPDLPDEALANQVKRALATEPLVAAAVPEIETRSGTVTLRGFVPATLVRVSAEKLAIAVPGVLRVRNELVSDEEVAAEINRRLSPDPDLRRSGIRARLEAGRVYWQSRQATDEDRRRAAVIAADVLDEWRVNKAPWLPW